MNIITEESSRGRILDGIGTLLKLDDKTFEKVIEHLKPSKIQMEDFNFFYTTDDCSRPNQQQQLGLEEFTRNGESIVRGYYASGSNVSIQELFKIFHQLATKFELEIGDQADPTSSKRYVRLKRLLHARGLEAYKEFFVETTPGTNSDVVDKVFEVLSSEELFEKFLDYEHNKEAFSIEGIEDSRREICVTMEKIFGDRRYDGSFRNLEDINRDFYIPAMNEYAEKVSRAYEEINFARYTDGQYEFKSILSGKPLSRKGDEPDFTIHPEMRSAVLDGMPADLTLEEKIAYIHIKVCSLLSFDDGFLIRNQKSGYKYKGDFSKEVMESIKPGSKIICTDIARLEAKFINELEGDVEAVVLLQNEGQRLHASVGVYTDKISTILDGTNPGVKGLPDDLTSTKLRTPIHGIRPIYDSNNIMKRAVAKIYPMIIGGPVISMRDYIKEAEEFPRVNIWADDLDLRLRKAMEIAGRLGISGNETAQFLIALRSAEFFGPFTQQYYINEEVERNGGISLDRIILYQKESFNLENTNPLHVITTKNGQIEELSAEEISRKYYHCKWESGERRCKEIRLAEDEMEKPDGIAQDQGKERVLEHNPPHSDHDNR